MVGDEVVEERRLEERGKRHYKHAAHEGGTNGRRRKQKPRCS